LVGHAIEEHAVLKDLSFEINHDSSGLFCVDSSGGKLL
jgi:hypothetical protein